MSSYSKGRHLGSSASLQPDVRTSNETSSWSVLQVTDGVFFPSTYDQSAKCAGHESNGKKHRDPCLTADIGNINISPVC